MLTAEQKKKRLEGVGGSEIAAIAGLNPYATALDVWRSKVEGWEQPVTPPMERGTFLEAGIADWYAHRTGATLREVGTIFHPSFLRVFCTPDRLARMTEEHNLSIKAPGPYVREQWGEGGTDEVPVPALLQFQWELITLEATHGIRWGHLAAPVDGDLRIYVIHADADLQAQLVQLAQKFWRDFVETKTPPPLDGSESSARWLAAKFPEHRPSSLLPATPEADALMRRLKEAREAKARAELEEEEAKSKLKAILGECEGMAADAWRCTWRNAKGAVRTDWEAVAREAGAPQALIEKFSHTTNGSRRFVPTWKDK